MPAVALCGGVALYLVALSALKRRNIGSFNYPRLVAAAVLAVLAAVATAIPALLALALVAGVVLRPDRLRDGALRGHARSRAPRVGRSLLAPAALCGAANSIIEGKGVAVVGAPADAPERASSDAARARFATPLGRLGGGGLSCSRIP